MSEKIHLEPKGMFSGHPMAYVLELESYLFVPPPRCTEHHCLAAHLV